MIFIWLILGLLTIQNGTHAEYSTSATIYGSETRTLIDPPFDNINRFVAPVAEQTLPAVPNLIPYDERSDFQSYYHPMYGMVLLDQQQNVYQQPELTWHQQCPYCNPTMFGTYNEQCYPMQAASDFFHPYSRYPLQRVVPNLLTHGETSAFERYDNTNIHGTSHPNRQESVLQQPEYTRNQQWSDARDISNPEDRWWPRPAYTQNSIQTSSSYQNWRNVYQQTPTIEEFQTISDSNSLFRKNDSSIVLPVHDAGSASVVESLDLLKIAPEHDVDQDGEDATFQRISVASSSKTQRQDVSVRTSATGSTPFRRTNILDNLESKESADVHFASKGSLNSSSWRVVDSTGMVSEITGVTKRHLEEYPGIVSIAKQQKESQSSLKSATTTLQVSLLRVSLEQSVHLASNETTQVMRVLTSNCSAHKRSISKYACSSSSSKTPLSQKMITSDKLETYSSSQHSRRSAQNANMTRYMEVRADEKRYACKQCNHTFGYKQNFYRHVRIHADEKKPFACKHCNSSFNYREHLKRHIRIHTGEKPYACKQCKCSFSRKDYLDQHFRIHTGERPYICNHCSCSFRRKCTLNRHILTHTGEKPYACKQCNSSFNQIGYLKQHIRIHTDENGACNKWFRNRSNLLFHERKHNTEKEYKRYKCKFPERTNRGGRYEKMGRMLNKMPVEEAEADWDSEDDIPLAALLLSR